MSASKKAFAAMKYQLTGATKKSGVNLWRFVFSAVERSTLQERMFFIELAMLNPSLSPSEAVLGFKPRIKISSDDLQDVLAGTVSAQRLESENMVLPSYVVVRAGVMGAQARQICEYYPLNDFSSSSRNFEINVGKCHFDEEKLSGFLECSPKEAMAHPEYLCDSGSIGWNLKYDMSLFFDKGFKNSDLCWCVPGAKSFFSGNITLDGKEYDVIPKKSYGYIDRNWGKNYPSDWFHISSSNLASLINGKAYQNSCISIQGDYDGRLSVLISLEKKEFSFTADSAKRKYQCVSSCSQMPENEDGERLHWSVSVHNRLYVIDVDVFCPAKLMTVRDWELPEGSRKTLKILSGGNGSGEVRLYKKHGKGLELVEHLRIAGALSEFGKPEEAVL